MAWNWGGTLSGAGSGASMGSTFGPWGTVIGGIGGAILGGLTSEQKQQQADLNLQPDKESWQMALGQKVSDWASKYMDQYVPGKEYTGKFTAPMSSYEQSGLNWLDQYMQSPNFGQNYQLAQDELSKTMTGAYDPYESKYYKALREGAGMEMSDAITQMRRGQGARGTYFADTSMREENVMRQKSTNYLQQLLGSMAEKERERRYNAIPTAMSMEQYAQGIPLEKAKAGLTLGTLPRLLEQADLEANYNDFLRKQKELAGVIPAAQGVFGTSMDYGLKNYQYQSPQQESPFARIMASVGPLISSYMNSRNAGMATA